MCTPNFKQKVQEVHLHPIEGLRATKQKKLYSVFISPPGINGFAFLKEKFIEVLSNLST